MSSLWKTIRLILSCLAVMAAGFWASVTFLGEKWSDQARYLLQMMSLLVLILVSAALLLGVFKLLGLLWQQLTGVTTMQDSDDKVTSTHNEQE